MKKVSKKFLCFLLCVVMILCSLPTLSISAETTENNICAEKELIETQEDSGCTVSGRTGALGIGDEVPDDVFVIDSVED